MMTLRVFATAVAANQPLVIRGGCGESSDRTLWTRSRLSEAFRDVNVSTIVSDTQSFIKLFNNNNNYALSVPDVLNCIHGNKTKCNVHHESTQSLAKLDGSALPLLEFPSMAHMTLLNRVLVWFGSSSSTYQPYLLTNISQTICVVQGSIQVRLSDVYPTHHFCQQSHALYSNNVEVCAGDDPPPKKSRLLVATVRRGDVLFIPSQWWRRFEVNRAFYAYVHQYAGNRILHHTRNSVV